MSANIDTIRDEVKSKLFGLHNLAEAKEDEYQITEGEETDLTEWLSQLTAEQAMDTAHALCLFVDEINGRQAKMKIEQERLSEAKKMLEARGSWAFRRMRMVVEKFGEGPRKKITAGPFVLALRKSTRLELDPKMNPLDLPEEFLRYKDPEPKKDEMKKALKAGEVIDGATLVDHYKVEVKNG